MKVNLNWNVCRTCLQEGELKSIFEQDDSHNVKYSDMLKFCTGLEIITDTNLPKEICAKCLSTLNASYNFRKVCITSEKTLQEFLRQKIGLELQLNDTSVTSNENDDPFDDGRKERNHEQDPPVLNIEDNFYIDSNSFTVDDFETGNQKDEIENQQEDDVCSIEMLEDADITEDETNITNIKEEPLTDTTDSIFDFPPSEDEQNNDNDNEQTVDTKTSEDDHFLNANFKEFEPESEENQSSYNTVSLEEKSNKRQRTVDETFIDFAKPTVPVFVCDVCGNVFQKKFQLNTHMKIHYHKKKFECEICGKAFGINSSQLTRHMRVHTGEKPFQCKFCSRAFSDPGSRSKHQRTHTGEKPFSCRECGKSFTYSSVLHIHMLTHSGERNFECEICVKKFQTKHHLKEHYKTQKHQKNVEDFESSKTDNCKKNFNTKQETDNDASQSNPVDAEVLKSENINNIVYDGIIYVYDDITE